MCDQGSDDRSELKEPEARDVQESSSPYAQLDSRALVPAVVALVGGWLVGDGAKGIARFILGIADPVGAQVEFRVAEVALIVLLVVTGAIAGLGALGIRRRWVGVEALVVSVVAGVLTAVSNVLSYGLPACTSGSEWRTAQPIYFLMWVVGFWIVPGFYLPNRGDSLERRLLAGYRLLVIASGMTLVGLLVGFLTETVVSATGRSMLAHHGLPWQNPEQLWIAKPLGMNAICGGLVVVVFAPIWWRGLKWPTGHAWVWMVVATTVAVIYSGLWGLYLYKPCNDVSVTLHHFVGFGALPLLGVVAVASSYVASRRRAVDLVIGWSAARWFWGLLAVAFALVCGLNAAWGLAPIEGYGGMQRAVLVGIHSLNGVFLGGSLAATVVLFRLMPESER